MTGPIEFWHVQMPDGSVSTMTLDDLDDAFQNDRIHEGTYVLKQGEQKWATLAELLGLDDEPAASVTPPPVAAAPFSYPPPASSAPIYSLRPVVSEIDDSELDFGGPQFRSSKKRKAIIAGSVAGVAIIAIAVAALGSSSDGTPVAAVKPPTPVAAAAPPPPPVVATPAPVDTAPPADRLTDTQKKALADADKTHATQAAQKAAARAASAPVHHNSYKSDGKPVFHKGGDKHDPLNSSL
jgi:hypothetical protein